MKPYVIGAFVMVLVMVLLAAQRADNVGSRDSSLIPYENKDLPNGQLSGDAVSTLSLTGLPFVPLILQVRADGDFQWSTGDDPQQGVGDWEDANAHVRIPVNGKTSVKFISRWPGATVHVYSKALGGQ